MAKPRAKKAKKGDTVKVQYTCKLLNGTVIDSSVGQKPLEFTIGEKEVIKGLEEAVRVMKVGESKKTKIPAIKTYGPYHDEWVLEIGKDKLPEDWKPKVGLRFELPRDDDQFSVATVVRVSELSVTLDFNHPLAGKDLVFDISLLEIL